MISKFNQTKHVLTGSISTRKWFKTILEGNSFGHCIIIGLAYANLLFIQEHIINNIRNLISFLHLILIEDKIWHCAKVQDNRQNITGVQLCTRAQLSIFPRSKYCVNTDDINLSKIHIKWHTKCSISVWTR